MPAYMVHGYKVFWHIQSILGWYQSGLAILHLITAYKVSTLIWSTFFGQNADLTSGLQCMIILVRHVVRHDQSPGSVEYRHRIPTRLIDLPRDGPAGPVVCPGSVVKGVELGSPRVHIPHMKDLLKKILTILYTLGCVLSRDVS